MTTNRIYRLMPAAIGLLCAVYAGAQPTSFTYQGRLTENGVAAEGVYDVRFSLHPFESDGGVIGEPITHRGLVIDGGSFAVTLNFGPTVFDGSPRWLEIAVSPSGLDAFQVLSPRQLVTSAPYALKALTADGVPAGGITSDMLAEGAVLPGKIAPGAVSQLGSPDGADPNVLLTTAAGQVGVGTHEPLAGLHVSASRTVVTPSTYYALRDDESDWIGVQFIRFLAASENLLAMVADYGITLVAPSGSGFPIHRHDFEAGVGALVDASPGRLRAALGQGLLVVESDGLLIFIDVSDPSNPVRLTQLIDPEGRFDASDMVIEGNVLAVASHVKSTVSLIDIADPAAPVLRAVLQDGLFGYDSLERAVSLAAYQGRLAIYAATDQAITLVDIANPSNPVKLGEIINGQAGVEHLENASSLAWSGDLLAAPSPTERGVSLIDVSDPAQPQLVTFISAEGYDHFDLEPYTVVLRGDRLIVADRYNEEVSLFSLSHPAQPELLALARDRTGAVHTMGQPQDIAMFGDRLAVAVSGPRRGFDRYSAFTVLEFVEEPVGVLSDNWLAVGTQRPVAPLHVNGNAYLAGDRFEVDARHIEMGRQNLASGYDSMALGIRTEATGTGSLAVGNETLASGENSMAAGQESEARGVASAAFGDGTIASGTASFAAGLSSRTQGTASTAFGLGTRADGDYSFAAGRSARANHHGTFVWSDSQNGLLTSTAPDQFLIKAAAGVGINKNDPATALDVNGTVTATSFIGDGSGLTGVPVPNRHSLDAADGSPADALWVDNAGKVGIGTTNPTAALSVVGDSDFSGRVSIGISGADSRLLVRGRTGEDAFRVRVETASKLVVKENGGLAVGANFTEVPPDGIRTAGSLGIGRLPTANSLEVNGDASKTTAGSWLANSDRRIKTDVQPIDHALETLDQVQLVSFRYTEDYRTGNARVEDRRYLNVVAQDFARVFPEHVKGSGQHLTNGEEILQVDAWPLTIYSAAAIQELNRKLQQKNDEIAELRRMIEDLGDQVQALRSATGP